MSEGPMASRVRVRYAETDQMDTAYHANYLVWFEVGRTGLLRATGTSYREMEERGLRIPVLEAYCRYRRPARYDDLLRVETTCRRVKRVRIRFDYQVLREEDGELLADGWTVHAVTDPSGVPRRVPAEVLRQLFPGAAGEEEC